MRVSRGKNKLLVAALAALGIVIAAAPASALDKLRTGKAIALPFDFTPLDIGMTKGFFQKHGLELDITAFAGSARLQQGLAADAIDIGLGSGPELAFVAKGAPVLGICAYAGPVNLMMVVRPDAGINSGFMMPQVTAAALASENKGLAHPASVDSITTSGNKEDYVSMGMTAAIKLKRVIANTTNVLAIEACAAAQALDFLAPLKTSQPLQNAHAAIRKVSPKIEHDRVFADDFAELAELIRAGALTK